MKARRARGIVTILIVAVTLGLLNANANADLTKGLDAMVHGDYGLARRALKETKGADQQRAEFELARLSQHVGDYKGAELRIRGLLSSSNKKVALDSHVLLAELLRQTGRYVQSRDLLKPQLHAAPTHHATRHGLGLSYEDLGQHTEANRLWNLFFDDFDAHRLDLDDAKTRYYIAEAARHLTSYKDSHENYEEAVEIDKSFHRANIDWGILFSRKYDPGNAERCFTDVLTINPNHADALAGMAELKVTASYDSEASQKLIERALAVNPNHVQALLVRASIEIDRNEWDKALATTQTVVNVNPESFEGRATLATVHWLRDDMKAYKAEKERVLRINPGYSRFLHVVMRSAEREHRYHQAVELGKEAIQINPRDYEAMQLLGSSHLRLGEEKQGIKWLRKAFYGDQYNVRTKNTLDLFEIYIPRQYELAKSKNFKVRYHKDERKAYERYITPMLERAFDDMVKRYGFKPKTPVTVELYQSAEHFSVRTIGLPNLGALGVCFGQVVTTMSPSVGSLNWGMVLWHELSHVFAIQLSDYRVPRWFTEGLSEYETIRARPEWRRENDSDLWAAVQGNTLPSVVEIDHAFMRPNTQEVMIAYHLSSVTIEYIVSEYGFDKIVESLRLFAKGRKTPYVIEKITGKTVAVFDKEFRAHLRRRLAPYVGTLYLPNLRSEDLALLIEAAKTSPDDAMSQARLALQHLYDGKAREADKFASAALKLDKKNAIALFILAKLAEEAKETLKAKVLYERLVLDGNDSFGIRVSLAMIATRMRDKQAFVAHLETAKSLDPERSFPYQELAEFYDKEGKLGLVLKELETYVMLEEMSLAPLMRLIKEYGKKSQWHRVVHFGEMALRLDPALGSLQLTLGKAHQELGAYDSALYAFDTALLIRPRLRRPAKAHIGRAKALFGLGKNTAGKRALNAALDLEPESAEALGLAREPR